MGSVCVWFSFLSRALNWKCSCHTKSWVLAPTQNSSPSASKTHWICFNPLVVTNTCSTVQSKGRDHFWCLTKGASRQILLHWQWCGLPAKQTNKKTDTTPKKYIQLHACLFCVKICCACFFLFKEGKKPDQQPQNKATNQRLSAVHYLAVISSAFLLSVVSQVTGSAKIFLLWFVCYTVLLPGQASAILMLPSSHAHSLPTSTTFYFLPGFTKKMQAWSRGGNSSTVVVLQNCFFGKDLSKISYWPDPTMAVKACPEVSRPHVCEHLQGWRLHHLQAAGLNNYSFLTQKDT